MNRFTALVLALILLWGAPVRGQQDSSALVIDLGDGYKIALPPDWGITENANTGGASLTDSDFTVFIDVLTPPQVAALVDVDATATPADVLEQVLSALYDTAPETIEAATLGAYPAAQRSFSDDESSLDGESIVIDLGGGDFAFFDIFVPRGTSAGDYADRRDELRALLATFGTIESESTSRVTPEPDPLAGIEPLPVTPLEPCLVTAIERDRTQIQVGPGLNRVVLAFLPVDREVPAVGRYSGEEGDWLQLNRAIVAPESGAAELWVQADEVNTSGNCDALIAVEPPPLIPLDAGGATPVPEWSVWPGAYELLLSAYGRATCPDDRILAFETAPALAYETQSGLMQYSDEGDALVFDVDEGAGTAFSRIGRNSYQGTLTLAGRGLPVRLTVQNPATLTGWLALPVQIDDMVCSAEVPLTLAVNS